MPLGDRETNSFIKNFTSSVPNLEYLPQTNTAVIEFPIHYRYQPIQNGTDFVAVTLPDPEVFIDCVDRDLYMFQSGTDAPLIDYLTDGNRPKNDLTQMIPVGKREHKKGVISFTI